ncbi:MAG: 30S ribosomal protein S1 [Rhodothermales bacterium]
MTEEQQNELETPEATEAQTEVATAEPVGETPDTASSETLESTEPTPQEATSEVEAVPDAEAQPEATTPEEKIPDTPTPAEEEQPLADVPEEDTAVAEVSEEAVTESTEDVVEAASPAVEAVADESPGTEDAAEVQEAGAAEAPSGEDVSPPDAVAVEAVAAEEPAETTVEAPTFGYTGEIVGRVVKLEDLEGEVVKEETGPEYDQLKALIEQTLTDVSEHEIVKGRVVSVGEKDIVIDIGFKSDGVISRNEFPEELEPGEEVEVYLERIEDYHGQLVLSKTKADKFRRWEHIEKAFENETVLEGTIVRRIKGGMIVELIDGLEAFLPGSQIDVRPVRDFDAYLEKRMEFKIVKINPTNENVVVSHKALIEKELESQRESILATMEPGQILEGTVKNITDFGVFIDLGGVDGLLHITDLSWGRVSHPSELVELDQQLKVVVLDYDKERQRISLGLKQLQPHPWENITERFKEDDVVEGKVVSITDYGAFVELEKGIEGLVHISEMSWTDHIRHPSQKVSLGQLVNVKILNIDHEGKKISLGMKQLEKNPWDGLSERYPPGTVLGGKVRNITNFGVFVEIEPGIDGLVHISDLSWTKKIHHPGEIVKKGQDLSVVILDIDEDRQRVSLGHKQIETNPWNDFANVYAERTEHTAKVVRVEDKGLVVELALDVQAFVPASELKNGPQNFQAYYHEGDELELSVLRFDLGQKEIVLSETAKERQAVRAQRERERREERKGREREERQLRDFKKSAKSTSGPTTLGELSGLEDLKAQMVAAEKAAEKAEAKGNEKAKTGDASEVEAPDEAAESAPPAVSEEAEEVTDQAAEAEAEDQGEEGAVEAATDVAPEPAEVVEEAGEPEEKTEG